MKWFFVLSLLFSVNCASRTTAHLSQNSSNQNGSTNKTANYNDEYEKAIRVNKEKVAALMKENEKFETVPDEFSRLDFKNFTYPTTYPAKSVTLKGGEYEYENKKSLGGGWFKHSQTYYVDLTGDGVKEALVLLFRVDCGGSCDGGAYLIYVYNPKHSKTAPLWKTELGNAGYGCGLKSLTVRDKNIMFDLFGRCDSKMKAAYTEEEFQNTGKFTSIGFTDYNIAFRKGKFFLKNTEFHPVGRIYHLNELPEIRINE